MPLIVTPHQLSQQAELYHQLGALTAAGIALPHSLGMLQQSAGSGSFRRPLQQTIRQLDQGATFSEAVARVRGWLPSFDIALLRAGEQSGRLDVCFKILSSYYNERAQLVRSLINDLLYPAFLLHFGIFILAFPNLFRTWNLPLYLRQTVGVLVWPYLLILLLVFACQGRHGEAWRALLERITQLIPILGNARRQLALARLCAALEALINAGVSIVEAWDMAAAASGSPAVRHAVRCGKPRILAGETPAEVVRANRAFPELFANLYHTGEISGQLDDALQRLHKYYQEEASRKFKTLAQWIPRLIYLVIVFFMASKVFEFWSNYFGEINKVLNF
jgi:type II secretory pathway component PulF